MKEVKQREGERPTSKRLPWYSRCKVGKAKWLWVLYSYEGVFCGEEPLAHGFAPTSEAAYETAVKLAGPVGNWGNGLADQFRRNQAAIRKSKARASKTDAASVEFVYECHRYVSEYDGSEVDMITKHRVVKKTKQRIYVEHEPYQEEAIFHGNWTDFVVRTFILDRAEFERNGRAERKRHGWWYDNTYYADPAIYYAERKSMDYCPSCLVGLELGPDAIIEDIKSAYRRLAKKHHPDRGGDADEFKRIRICYDEAMDLTACKGVMTAES